MLLGALFSSGATTHTRSIKTVTPSEDLAKEHYSDLAARPFYPGLVKYITSGTPVVAM